VESGSFGIVILAAGSSSRLGEPKQLLRYRGKSLIRHIAEAAVETVGDQAIVVTGSNAALIEKELKQLPYHSAFNARWEDGMSSSIHAGIHKLRHLDLDPKVKGAILAVSDQPFVSSTLFKEMIRKFEKTGSGIVACSYEDTLGTPVLFSNIYFDNLLALGGAEGAKKLLKNFPDDVVAHSFPAGSFDIDTHDDYQNLLNLS
jgi:molybdenum cofactor cytidylyltransferase